MRLIIILICLTLITAGCPSSGSKSSGDKTTDKVSISEDLSQIHLDVSGMTCEGCENAIVASIKKLDGIQEASASHTNAEATIVFDSTLTTVSDITRAIVDAGYSVDEKAINKDQ